MNPIDLRDPSKALHAITLLRGHVHGIVEAARDALRPPSKRRLPRSMARDAIEHGARSVKAVLDAVEAGLPPGTLMPHERPDPDRDPPSTDPARDE